MNTKYEDVEISYNEDKNTWEFELRGRQRSCESLAKAKEAIDKPVKETKETKFERFEAYKIERWGCKSKKVTVTSIAEHRHGGNWGSVWISDNGDREKVCDGQLYEVTKENETLLAELKSNDDKIKAIGERDEKIKRHLLTKIKLPKEEVEA